VLVLSTKSFDRTVSQSFNGGHGGDGVPPGSGGTAGADSADGGLVIDRSFMPGDPGNGCPVGTTRTASGSLTDGGGGVLAYSIQTDQPANAFRLTLPPGLDITGVSFPSGFTAANCTDNGNQETCAGGSIPANQPLVGSFAHSGTIAANCGCVQLGFSSDGGLSFYPVTPVGLLGPPTSSGPGQGPLTASILAPTGTATFLDGPLGGANTGDLHFQGQISGGTAPYTATINWGDGATSSGSDAMHAYPATTSLDDGKMVYPVSFQVSDAAGHMTSVAGTVTVLCSGITGPGFTADLGAGSLPTIVFCGHWAGGFVPAKIVFTPASGQTWQFSGAFNAFQALQVCSNNTTTLIAVCIVKDSFGNPTFAFGLAANINTPVISGMKITAEGEDSNGHVVQTMTGTVM
jgi:hypothetical protein